MFISTTSDEHFLKKTANFSADRPTNVSAQLDLRKPTFGRTGKVWRNNSSRNLSARRDLLLRGMQFTGNFSEKNPPREVVWLESFLSLTKADSFCETVLGEQVRGKIRLITYWMKGLNLRWNAEKLKNQNNSRKR